MNSLNDTLSKSYSKVINLRNDDISDFQLSDICQKVEAKTVLFVPPNYIKESTKNYSQDWPDFLTVPTHILVVKDKN